MKLAILLISVVLTCMAQPADFVAAGVSYNQGATPAVGGTGLYAHKLVDGTYSVSIADVLPTSYKPFLTQTNTSSGIAQKLYTLADMPIYVIGTAGLSTTGQNTGWLWSVGAGAPIKLPGGLGEKGWYVMPTFRIVNPNVSERRYIVGALWCWGK